MAFTIARIALVQFYRRLGTFLAANLLWILTSLPLVTLPAATGALFHLVARVIAEERDLDPEPATIADFWEGFRLHWQRSSLLGAIDIVALVVTIGAFFFYLQNENELLIFLTGPIFLIFLVLLAMQIYLFPLLVARQQLSAVEIAREAFIEVLRNPIDSLVLVAWIFILTVICTALGGPVLIILFSLIAILQSMALRVFRIQRGEIPPAKLNIDEEKGR